MASVSGDTLITALNPGTAHITASQTGSIATAAAKPVTHTIEVSQTTGIAAAVNDTQAEQPVYNLSGQRVNACKRSGIYISKGKKITHKQ